MSIWQFPFPPLKVQEDALAFAGEKNHIAWFIDPGLGKTKTALSDYLWRYQNHINDVLVIVCPNELKMYWLQEMQEMHYPFTKIFIWPKVKKFNPEYPRGSIIIINYEALNNKGIDFLQPFLRKAKAYLVFDESTYMGNPVSKRTKAAQHISGEVDAVRLLTGTPNPGGVKNLYGQFYAIRIPVGLWSNFKYRFCEMETQHIGKQTIEVAVRLKNEHILGKWMEGKVFRGTKKEYAKFLPEKVYTSIPVQMLPEQEKAYRTMAEELYAETMEGKVSVSTSLAGIMKLYQISSGYVLDRDGTPRGLVPVNKNPKIEAIKEIIYERKTKVIIFSRFKHSMRLLMDQFPDACFLLSKQEMSEEQFENSKRRFNKTDCKILIAQLQVAKYGHTLLGNEDMPCDTTIYFENMHLEIRLQSEDRNHRVGATHDTNFYYDLTASSIERYIVKKLQRQEEEQGDLFGELKNYVKG